MSLPDLKLCESRKMARTRFLEYLPQLDIVASHSESMSRDCGFSVPDISPIQVTNLKPG